MTTEFMKTNADLLTEAKEAEGLEKFEEAVRKYEEVIKADVLNENAYNRLMIIYRKLKEYRKELKVINSGIKAYESHYKPKSKNRKIAEISSALLKSTGLVDKKGNHLYDPEPVGTWKKRKVLVEKKLKS